MSNCSNFIGNKIVNNLLVKNLITLGQVVQLQA